MSMDRHYSYKDFTPIPPPRPPIDYATMTDRAFMQSVGTTVATAIALSWLCYRLYYSRMCCVKPENYPRTFHTRELGLMLIALIAWGNGAIIASSFDAAPISRRVYLVMCVMWPKVVYFASANLEFWMDEVPAVPVQVAIVWATGMCLAALLV